MAHFIHLIFLDQYLSKSFGVPYQWDMKIAIKKVFFYVFMRFWTVNKHLFYYVSLYMYIYRIYKQNVWIHQRLHK